jgi:hypothetical protein
VDTDITEEVHELLSVALMADAVYRLKKTQLEVAQAAFNEAKEQREVARNDAILAALGSRTDGWLESGNGWRL